MVLLRVDAKPEIHAIAKFAIILVGLCLSLCDTFVAYTVRIEMLNYTVILRTKFTMVVSLWHSHCESS